MKRSRHYPRCTNFAMAQLGVCTDEKIRDSAAALEVLREHGWGYSPLPESDSKGTVTKFVRDHPRGIYWIVTSGHAMSLRNGRLFDYEGKGPNKRRVQIALRLRKK